MYTNQTQQPNMKPTYQIMDRHTSQPVGKPYGSRTRANRRVDVLDNAYGAYRYYVLTVYPAAA